jgi:hypothetical protein
MVSTACCAAGCCGCGAGLGCCGSRSVQDIFYKGFV